MRHSIVDELLRFTIGSFSTVIDEPTEAATRVSCVDTELGIVPVEVVHVATRTFLSILLFSALSK